MDKFDVALNEWGDLLNSTAQTVFKKRVEQLTVKSPTVSIDPRTGKLFEEGQPSSIKGRIAEIPQIYLFIASGVLAVGFVYLMVRK